MDFYVIFISRFAGFEIMCTGTEIATFSAGMHSLTLTHLCTRSHNSALCVLSDALRVNLTTTM